MLLLQLYVLSVLVAYKVIYAIVKFFIKVTSSFNHLLFITMKITLQTLVLSL